ncbi:YjbF family lipoprotein [Ruegeria lacuscaerulensis]|uniref:YjbF family lipoprotein n=1 Tax=Ruegeria lacuscaerulensis TaxID=55218 RepID=UPI00147FC9B4|nr:YjbF family lipoprotein [Ruegeria lacuscaerulensis]
MRVFALLCLALSLAACGEARDEFYLLRGALRPDAPRFHPRADALAAQRPIPPRLEVAFPSRDLSGVMLLEVTRDDVQTWLTADGATITLEQGFLTSTKGFGSGMTGSDIRHSAGLILSRQEGRAERFHSFLNGNDEIELHAYDCRITALGPDTIVQQGNPVATRKWQEQCFGTAQSFTNTYWLRNGSQTIVQSSQWTGDFLGNLFMKAVPDAS